MARPHGTKYLTVEQVASLWENYKAWVDSDPDKEEVVTVKGEIAIRKIKRPYLQSGFYAYVYKTKGMHIHQYFDNEKGNYDDYLGICTHVKNEWQTDQISGTLTGRYKAPNLTARINGITDKQSIDIKSEQPLFGKKE